MSEEILCIMFCLIIWYCVKSEKVGMENRRHSRFCSGGEAMPHKKKAEIGPEEFFFLLAAGQFVFSLFYLARTGGQVLHTVIPSHGADQFMDFFNHISYVRDPGKVYFASQHACFPPLVYVMYYLFSRILPQDATVMYNTEATSTHALLLYVVYCVLLAVCFYYSVCRMLRNRAMEFSLAAAVAVLVSDIFIFGVTQRGNSVMIVCILLMLALDLRESRHAWHRELALVLIAVAAGIKIYPAVFGLLYLMEKRWKEAGRLLLYGMICFFVPFLFFGGMEGMVQLLKNQAFVHSMTIERFGSVKMSWERMLSLLEGRFSGLPDLSWVGVFLTMLIFLFWIAGACFCRKTYERVMLLAGIMVVVPFWSGLYTQIYMCLPFMMFLRDQEKREVWRSYADAGLFAMIFSLFLYESRAAALFGTSTAAAKSLFSIYILCMVTAGGSLAKAVRRKLASK